MNRMRTKIDGNRIKKNMFGRDVLEFNSHPQDRKKVIQDPAKVIG